MIMNDLKWIMMDERMTWNDKWNDNEYDMNVKYEMIMINDMKWINDRMVWRWYEDECPTVLQKLSKET